VTSHGTTAAAWIETAKEKPKKPVKDAYGRPRQGTDGYKTA